MHLSGLAQPGPLAPNDPIVNSHIKRHRTSPSPGASSPVDQHDSAVIMPSTSRATRTRDSSRESSPLDGATSVRYTRTGRVSRANKGQRVHHCEECGNTYTRAEHLRRHQQNHKPGAFPCDIPGCNRSFYREDLLIRHKMRHNESPSPSSPQPSPHHHASASSVNDNNKLPLPPRPGRQTSRIGHAPRSQQRQSLSLPGNRLDDSFPAQMNSSTQQQVPSIAFRQQRRDVTHGLSFDEGGESSGRTSVASSPIHVAPMYMPPNSCSVSAIPYYRPPFQHTRLDSNVSALEYYPPAADSYASVSSVTAIPYPLVWNNPQNFGLEQPYLDAFPVCQDPFPAVSVSCDADISDPQLLFQCRDLEEQAELAVPAPTSEAVSLIVCLDDPLSTTETRYAGTYWSRIHPLFPIVHRPSFERLNTSPLLKAAILALGANAENSFQAKDYARTVHEKCIKVLHKRTINKQHSFEIWDMQAVLLIEVYSIFTSRRPPLHLSNHFETIADMLVHTPNIHDDADFSRARSFCPPINTFYNMDDSASHHELECRQRLLAACYILDQQHALLFGRQRTPGLKELTLTLPAPRSQAAWDATGERSPYETHFLGSGWPTPPEEDFAMHFGGQSDNGFRGHLALAELMDSVERQRVGVEGILDPDQQNAQMQLAYHTLKLCDCTPVRHLLAVAGESWVMSDKMSTRAEYCAAQQISREWAAELHAGTTKKAARSSHSIQSATEHAVDILTLHHRNARTGLLYHEWSLYLASLVLWAGAYVTSDPHKGKAVINTKSPVSCEELEMTISAVIKDGSSTDVIISLDDAMLVLQWTKNRIHAVDMSHHSGLTNGAVDVLSRLLARWREAGWFG